MRVRWGDEIEERFLINVCELCSDDNEVELSSLKELFELRVTDDRSKKVRSILFECYDSEINRLIWLKDL
jgi:hypothetical protein